MSGTIDDVRFNHTDVYLDRRELKLDVVDENYYRVVDQEGNPTGKNIKFIDDPKTGAKFPQLSKLRDIFTQSKVTRSVSFDKNGHRTNRITYIIPSLEKLNKNRRFSNQAIKSFDLVHFKKIANAQNIITITEQAGFDTNKILALPHQPTDINSIVNIDLLDTNDSNTLDFLDYLISLDPQKVDDRTREELGLSSTISHILYAPRQLQKYISIDLIPAIMNTNLFKDCTGIMSIVLDGRNPFETSKLYSNTGTGLFASTLDKDFQRETDKGSLTRIGRRGLKPVYALAVGREDFADYLTALSENSSESKVHSLLRRYQRKYGSTIDRVHGTYKKTVEIVAIPEHTHEYLYDQRQANKDKDGSGTYYPQNVFDWCVEQQKIFDMISSKAQQGQDTSQLIKAVNDSIEIYEDPERLQTVQLEEDSAPRTLWTPRNNDDDGNIAQLHTIS